MRRRPYIARMIPLVAYFMVKKPVLVNAGSVSPYPSTSPPWLKHKGIVFWSSFIRVPIWTLRALSVQVRTSRLPTLAVVWLDSWSSIGLWFTRIPVPNRFASNPSTRMARMQGLQLVRHLHFVYSAFSLNTHPRRLPLARSFHEDPRSYSVDPSTHFTLSHSGDVGNGRV